MSDIFTKAHDSGEIKEALLNLGVNLKCPRCSCLTFNITAGHFKKCHEKEDEFHIETALILCDKCGFITEHALYVILNHRNGIKKEL